MIVFLKNWIQGIAVSVILASIFEILFPDGKLKKYMKVVLGLYIIFSMISPFVDKKQLYNFDMAEEIEKYTQDTTNGTAQNIDTSSNMQEIYIDTFEKGIISKINKYGFNVRSCLVDASFEGNEDEIGIKKITIVLSSRNDNYYEKDEEESSIKKVETVIISVEKQKELNEKNKITPEDIENLRNYLADYYEVKKNIIQIDTY